MSENITPRLDRVLKNGRKEAIDLGNNYVGVEHIILAILDADSGIGAKALKEIKSQVSFIKVRESICNKIKPKKKNKDTSILSFNKELEQCLIKAKEIADMHSHVYIGTEHFLIAALENESSIIYSTLKEFGIEPKNLKEALKNQLVSKDTIPQKVHAGDSNKGEKENQGESFLKKFAIDLTEKAAKHELDSVIGRSSEVGRAIRILARKKKNNPVFVGPAGVGKTSIVEGLAIRIYEKKVPEKLLNKKIFALDFPRIIAGTVYRGQFEERLKKILKEVRDNKNFIVFIDELHTVIGAGSGEGSMDAANMIKPALARGEFCCIGATTEDEFKYIEKDPALERRFQKISVEEPSVTDTIEILKGSAKDYEKFHGVKYTDEAIKLAVYLSNRFIHDRYQPDKSIDILDEAGASVKLIYSQDKDKELVKTKLSNTRRQKALALKSSDFEEAQRLKNTEQSLVFKLNKLELQENSNKLTVDENDIRQIVGEWSSIPVEDLKITDKAEILNLGTALSASVISQKEAIDKVTRALKKYRTPFKNPNKPIGGFLFCGPTGVGKTLLAETIALKIFGSSKSMLALDMSEYADSTAVTKLIGASAGYVGYEDGAKLCKYVRKRPYSVILFDEIEKAHQDVCQLLLQILEHGRLTDNLGRSIDFKNTIIICTSNAGSMASRAMGFGTSSDLNKRTKDNIEAEVKKIFKSEFLNRLELIIFNPLSDEDAKKIAALEIDNLNSRLKEYNISIKYNKSIIDFIVKNGFDKIYGGRNIRRQIEIYIEDLLTDEFLKGKIQENSVITLRVFGQKIKYSTKKL